MNLLEDKKTIINRIPSLTLEQKKQLIDFFALHPNYESNINWNNWKSLTMANFAPLLKIKSKSQIKKAVKAIGIKGLEEGIDYVTCYAQDFVAGSGNTYNVSGYCPLDWEASKKIASTYVGGTEGEWCVAYQKSDTYWNDYVGSEGSIFIYFIDYNPKATWGKVAVRVYNPKRYEVWNKEDNKIYYTGSPSMSYYAKDNDYPAFLYEPSEMEPIIKVALAKIEEAGGVRAEQTKFYDIMVNAYAEIKDDHIDGWVDFVEIEFDGNDSDTTGNSESSKFFIYKVGVNGVNSELTEFLHDFENFNAFNGNGIYIIYDGDNTPEDAEGAASRTLQGNINNDYDTWDIKRSIEKYLGKNHQYDYVIVAGGLSIDNYLESFLDNNFNSSPNTIDDKDYNNNDYTIYYTDGYNYTKQGNNELTSLPSQRRKDRQLDFEYGA